MIDLDIRWMSGHVANGSHLMLTVLQFNLLSIQLLLIGPPLNYYCNSKGLDEGQWNSFGCLFHIGNAMPIFTLTVYYCCVYSRSGFNLNLCLVLGIYHFPKRPLILKKILWFL